METLALTRAALGAALSRPAWWLGGVVLLACGTALRWSLGGHGLDWDAGPRSLALVPAAIAWSAVGWAAALQSVDWLAERVVRARRWAARANSTFAVTSCVGFAVSAASGTSLTGATVLEFLCPALAVSALVALAGELPIAGSARVFLVASVAWVVPTLRYEGVSGAAGALVTAPILSAAPEISESSVLRWVDAAPLAALLLAASLLRRANHP